MDDLTSRFLDSFATIEKHLRRMLDANRSATFNELLGRAVSRNRSVRRLRDQLKTLRELRNFLVHEYKSEQPLAVPSESTVLRIQIIRDELLSPVRLVDLFRPPVEICSPSDPIGVAAKRMLDGSFARCPACRWAGNPGGETRPGGHEARGGDALVCGDGSHCDCR